MAETTTERLARLLSMITFVQDHPGIPVAEVAAHFGVSPAQVLADVNLLWVSGTPGYLPDDLIDFSYDSFERGLLTLTDARGMDRPLRLSPSESVALLAAVRALGTHEGLPESDVIASVVEKLTAAAGEAASAAHAVDVRLARAPEAGRLATLRGAIRDRRVVHLRYVSGSDVVSERDVDPLDLLTDGSRWFLTAWCHRAEDVRHFRLDRILGVDVLADPAGSHLDPAVGDTTGEPDLTTADLTAVLELAPQARWVAESLPVDRVTALADGWLAVELRVVDPAWLRALVLGLGPDVRAVRPDVLARDIAAEARRALAAYERLA